MSSIIEISDFELIDTCETKNENENKINNLFSEITEKDNQTSKFKRNCIILNRFIKEIYRECVESLSRCYYFGQNEINNFVINFKEKYSEQLNETDIEMGIDLHYDMQRD